MAALHDPDDIFLAQKEDTGPISGIFLYSLCLGCLSIISYDVGDCKSSSQYSADGRYSQQYFHTNVSIQFYDIEFVFLLPYTCNIQHTTHKINKQTDVRKYTRINIHRCLVVSNSTALKTLENNFHN